MTQAACPRCHVVFDVELRMRNGCPECGAEFVPGVVEHYFACLRRTDPKQACSCEAIERMREENP